MEYAYDWNLPTGSASSLGAMYLADALKLLLASP